MALENIISQAFIPHGYCFSWNSALLWTLVVSDLLIAVSYFSIPFALWYFARKRPDIGQMHVISLFGLFIVACGITHIFDVINIWTPWYWGNALAKAVTAVVSLTTAIVLWHLMPVALQAPSFKQLEDANRDLALANRQLQEASDILEQRVSERTEALAHSEEQLRLVLEGAELGFWDWNIQSGEVERNARWAHMLGYDPDEIRHTTKQWTDFIHPEDRDKAWESINNVLEGRSPRHKLEYRMLHKDGSIRWILDQANVMARDANGRPLRMSGTHIDITDRKQLEVELERQAHIDYLTGASNRGHFMLQGETELSRAVRYGKPLSLLMLDIDLFKLINDSHGHKAGDDVLKKLVETCRETLREVDIIGRIGGEEFAVLLPETPREQAAEVAERLRVELQETRIVMAQGLPLHFTVSIGVASMTSREENVDMLLNAADGALYEAKEAGRNRIAVATQ